jgi:hypothetical protein
MIPDIEQILDNEGPMLSSSVIQRLSETGLSKASARQRVARAKKTVYRLKQLQFPNRSQFLYLPSQYKKQIYWDGLLKAIEASSLYGCGINALRARGDMMPRYLFDVYSGSPTSPLKGHQVSETILRRLLEVEVIRTHANPSIGTSIVINESINSNIDTAEIRARLLAESILILAVKQWVRNVGIASYHKVKTRGEGANFGKFAWDLVCPSYIYPFRDTISKGTKPKPGFFVCDVMLAKDLSPQSIRFFLNKNRILRIQRNTRPFMSMLLAQGYDKNAFGEGRTAGTILTTPRTLFGDQVADGLKSLVELLTKRADADGEAIHLLFSNLSKIEGAAHNLRGSLFELVVARLVFIEHGGSWDLGRTVIDPTSGALAEMDVFLVCKGHEVRTYECKGKEPGGTVSSSEVEEWLTRKVPKIRSWIISESRFSGFDLHFEIWTSGIFSPDALEFLKSSKDKIRKYNIAWKEGSQVLQTARDQHETRIVDLLSEQFLRHPLAK